MTNLKLGTIALLVGVLVAFAAAPNGALGAEPELVNKEGKALVKNKFTATVGTVALENVHKLRLTCKEGTASGVVTSTRAATVETTLRGCEASGVTCNTASAKEGEIELDVALSALGKSGGTAVYSATLKEVIIKCPKLEGEVLVKGGFLVPIGTAQEKTLKSEFEFKAEQKEGKQIPLEYENPAKEKLKFTLESTLGGEGFAQTGLSTLIKIKYEEQAMIT